MSEPQISAIICTHNREEYLGSAIDSLLEQDFYSYEVIVVDNACDDRTREIVAERLSNPRLNYVYEPVLGLSVARNTGAKEALAPLLAYIDDDAVASPSWLKAIYTAFANNEKLVIAGGKVTLLLPNGRILPSWLSPELTANLGAYDLGDTIVEIKNPNLSPRGLNYSLRRSFLEEMGGFNVNLGRIGKKLLSNEELHMTEMALQAGWKVAYLPDAVVAHNVAPERLEPIWFLSRGWWQGISECYCENLAGRASPAQLLWGSERLVSGFYNSLKSLNDRALCFNNLVYTYSQIGYLNAVIQGIINPTKALNQATKTNISKINFEIHQ
jgi:glycosyltransferase involved in cell wall biosynthesis